MNKILILAIVLASSTSARSIPTRSAVAPAAPEAKAAASAAKAAPVTAAKKEAEGISRPDAHNPAQIASEVPMVDSSSDKQKALGEALGEAAFLDEDASRRESRHMTKKERVAQKAEWDAQEAEWDVVDELHLQRRKDELERDKRLANKDGSKLEKTASKNKPKLSKKTLSNKKNSRMNYGRKLNGNEKMPGYAIDSQPYVGGGNSSEMTAHGEGSNVPSGELGGSYTLQQ